MFYDPDAPKVDGQPDYSKGCVQDLPDDMLEQPQEPAAPAQQPASTSTTASSSSSSSESDSSSHSPHRTYRHGAAAASVPSHIGVEDMTAFYPDAADSSFRTAPPSSSASLPGPPSESFLTSVSPYLSVLYAVLAVVLVLSFYLVPQSRLRRRQTTTTISSNTDKQQAIERILAAAKQQAALQQQPQSPQQMTTATGSTPPADYLLSSSPLTARYLTNASTIPLTISQHFTPLELHHTIRTLLTAFDEDISTGDITTLATVPATATTTARFLVKEPGTISGTHVVDLVFHLYDPQLTTVWSVTDGSMVAAGTVIGVVSGASQSLLTAERLALNILQRMSGIATHTSSLRSLIAATRSATLLLDTRKTVPGLRMLDKMAVRHGGGVNHRVGLYDMVMIKDNHITAAGSIPQAIIQTQQYLTTQQQQQQQQQPNQHTIPIEVETRTIAEVKQLLTHLHSSTTTTPPVTRIMLDNMVAVRRDSSTGSILEVDVSMLREAVELLKADEIGRGLESEASGNVTAETIAAIAGTGVTYISVGAVTHSVRALDISLKIQ